MGGSTIKSIYRRRNALYSGLQGIYWMLYCISVSFASFFLLQSGLSSSEVGLVMALGFIGSTPLQSLLAAVADRNEKISTSGMILVGVFGCVISLIPLALLHGKSLLLCAAYVVFIAFSLAVQPLVNAMAFYIERLETPVNFGIARGLGSFFYAVLAVILGRLTVLHGEGILPVFGLAICAVFLLLTVLLRREGSAPARPKQERASNLSFSVLWTKHRSFLFLLLGTFGLFVGHTVVNNFQILVVENVGGDSADLGALCSYTALVEIAPMFLFNRLQRRFSVESLMKFAAVTWILRIALIPLAPSVPMLFVINTLQGPSFAVLTLASIRYVDSTMSAEDSNKGQALLTIAVTLANIVSCSVGGVLIDRIAIRPTLFLGAAVTALGAASIVFGMKKRA